MSAVDRARGPRCFLALLVTCFLAVQPVICSSSAQAQAKLNLTIVEGEGAINNIRQRTAREPIVQVVDENNRPVAGATVAFLLPGSGPGGTFPGGARSLTVLTNKNGQAVAKGLRHNGQAGKFEIQVNASYQDLTATTTIHQANAVLTAAAAGGISGKLIAILAIAGAAAAGGVFAAKGKGGGGGTPTPGPPATTITPGMPSVGGPP